MFLFLGLVAGSVLFLWALASMLRPKRHRRQDSGVRDTAWWIGTILWWGMALVLVSLTWMIIFFVLGGF